MSTQEIFLEEIKHQPEPVLRELWHYLKFLTRQCEEQKWAGVHPTREVEQEVLDILEEGSREGLCPVGIFDLTQRRQDAMAQGKLENFFASPRLGDLALKCVAGWAWRFLAVQKIGGANG